MKTTILLADTDVVLLELLQSRCIALGLSVEVATRGDDVLRAVRAGRPDLLCIGASLRSSEGLCVCEVLAHDVTVPCNSLIMLSNGTDECSELKSCLPSAHVVSRGGNLWHRLAPLLHELMDARHQAQTRSAAHATALSPGAPRSGQPASHRAERALRIDAPFSRPVSAGANKPGPERSSVLIAVDAREEVLDAVFAWFGGNEKDAPSTPPEATPANLSGPHRRETPELPWVLCIEDDDDFSMAIKLRLEARGVAVVRAFNGTAGYRAAFTHPASAILLDYNLPQGQGDYVLRRLKENPVTADVPVIVITGIRSAATRRQMLALGADAYLTKPIDFTELFNALGKHVHLLEAEYAGAS